VSACVGGEAGYKASFIKTCRVEGQLPLLSFLLKGGDGVTTELNRYAERTLWIAFERSAARLHWAIETLRRTPN